MGQLMSLFAKKRQVVIQLLYYFLAFSFLPLGKSTKKTQMYTVQFSQTTFPPPLSTPCTLKSTKSCVKQKEKCFDLTLINTTFVGIVKCYWWPTNSTPW